MTKPTSPSTRKQLRIALLVRTARKARSQGRKSFSLPLTATAEQASRNISVAAYLKRPVYLA